MKAIVKGIYEGAVQITNDGKLKVSMILNQVGEEDKVKVTVSDGYELPKKIGDEVSVLVNIRKGVINGKPWVSIKTA